MNLQLLVIAILTVQLCNAEIFKTSTTKNDQGFKFIGKFCFGVSPDNVTNSGTMQISVSSTRGSTGTTGLRLFLFDDEPNSWPSVYGKDLDCQTSISKAKNYVPAGQAMQAQYVVDFSNSLDWVSPAINVLEVARPRFWFVVLANCDGFSEITTSVHFENNVSPWQREFGVNQWWLNSLYLVFFLFFFLLFCIWVAFAVRQYRQVDSEQKLHVLIKLMSGVLTVHMVGLFILMLHFMVFTNNGIGIILLQRAGDCLLALSHIGFILLLLLLAQGWTITTIELTHKKQLLAIVSALFISYLLLFVWNWMAFDPASTLYFYSSIPGALLVVVDCVVGVCFIYRILVSVKGLAEQAASGSDEDKTPMFRALGIAYGIWFFTLPFIVLVSLLLEPWVRERIVTLIAMVVTTVAYSGLLFLLWPTRASRYFKIPVPIDIDSSYQNL